MAENRWVELPEHVVVKIEKVLGIPPSELAQHDIVKLVEELCDMALMFVRADRRGGRIPLCFTDQGLRAATPEASPGICKGLRCLPRSCRFPLFQGMWVITARRANSRAGQSPLVGAVPVRSC